MLVDLDYLDEVFDYILLCCIGELEEVVVVIVFLCLFVVSYIIG